MADNVFDRFLIAIQFDNNKFKESTKQTNDIIEKFTKDVTQSFRDISTLAGLALGGFGLTKLALDFANTGSQIAYMSDTLDESTKKLQIFQQASMRMGGTKEGTNAMLANLQGHLTNMANGQDIEYSRILSTLGISPFDSKGNAVSNTDLAEQIGQALYKKPISGFQGQRYWESMLGLDHNQLRFLEQPAQDRDALFANVQSSGIYNQDQVNTAKEAQQNLQALSQQFKYTTDLLGAEFIPGLTKAFTLFNSTFPKIIDFINGIFDKFSGVINVLMPGTIENRAAGDLRLKKDNTYFPNIKKMFNPNNEGVSWKSFKEFFSPDKNFNSDLNARAYQMVTGNKYNPGNVSNPSGSTVPYWQSPAILAAQRLRENAKNDPFATRTDKGITSVGLYQMTQPAAQQVTGKWYMQEELTDPKLNEQLRNKYMDYWAQKAQKAGLTDEKQITSAALAGYNGGSPDFNYFLKNGKSFNGYAESIQMNAATKFNHLNTMQQGVDVQQQSSNAGNNANGGITINGNIHVQANNAEEFGRSMRTHDRVRTAMQFNNGIMA